MSEFDGRVALVTGAASGIGEATARLLAARGARVVLADIADAAEIADAIGRDGGEAVAMPLDVRDSASIARVVAASIARVGGIDLLANVAGVFPPATLADTDDALIDEVLAVNIAGTMRMCRGALPHLTERGGAIVNIASGAAVRAIPGFAAYAASKGGVVAFSRTLAAEAAPAVRVNIVSPGATATAIVRQRAAAAGGRPGGMADTPLGRMAEPEEVAEAIAFLLSPRARFITGQMLFVNGGSFMH